MKVVSFCRACFKRTFESLCSACGRIELNCGSSTGSQPAGGFGYSSCCECEEAPTGKVVLVLLSGLNKGAEINAFRNPNAENIYTFLRESGLLANSKIPGPTLSGAKPKLSFIFGSLLPLALQFINT